MFVVILIIHKGAEDLSSRWDFLALSWPFLIFSAGDLVWREQMDALKDIQSVVQIGQVEDRFQNFRYVRSVCSDRS